MPLKSELLPQHRASPRSLTGSAATLAVRVQVSVRRSMVGTGAVMAGHSFGLRSCGIANPWRLKTFKILYSQACPAFRLHMLHATCATWTAVSLTSSALRVLAAQSV